MPAGRLEIETENESSGICDCCGSKTRTIWGWIHGPQATEAGYFVQWTEGAPMHGALFKLAIGPWGDGLTNEDRISVRLEYRITDDGGGFMVQDADASMAQIASYAMARTEVIGTPLASQCFEYVDAIWVGDKRVAEITGWART